MKFEFFAFRFHFEAKDSIFFPPGKSGNILRGAFGAIFRKLACAPDCPSVRSCEARSSCPYARIFEPGGEQDAPSGLADWPRPFVFRAAHLDGRTIEPGSRFHFDAHVFYNDDPAIAYFVLAFQQLAREGLGPSRGRAALERVERIGGPVVFDGATLLLSHPPLADAIDLHSRAVAVSRVAVRFVTPTELKSGAALVQQPEFGVLFARLRDRISTLRALYGSGPLDIDFRAFGERASHVEMVRCDLSHEKVQRRSSRTGQTHPIGGFTGEAVYEGELTEFLPWLEAGYWTGVGRQTVWGKGVIESRLVE